MAKAIRMSERTHCVTFLEAGKRFFAEPSRQYSNHDPIPQGVTEPSISCAMPLKKAYRLAEFLRKESSFKNIKVMPLNVKAS